MLDPIKAQRPILHEIFSSPSASPLGTTTAGTTSATYDLVPEKVEACPQVDKCKKEHGTCKEWCDPYKYERELKWLCDPWIPQPAAIHPYVHKPRSPARISTGPACKCCAPKCEKSPSCTLWGGTCVNGHKECPTQYGFMVVDGCKGYDCKCCKPGE